MVSVFLPLFPDPVICANSCLFDFLCNWWDGDTVVSRENFLRECCKSKVGAEYAKSFRQGRSGVVVR